MGKELAIQAEERLPSRPIADTPGAAAAARAKAEIEAAYTIALHKPRVWAEVRQRVLAVCKTSVFADDKSAWYRIPVGGGKVADGPGIRLAEEYQRTAGNMICRTSVVYEDEKTLIVRALAVDLDSNAWQEQEVRIEKTVWRKKLRAGQETLSQKTNAQGDTTYLVAADEDALRAKIASASSKSLRNCIVRLMPRDLIQAAKKAIFATRKSQAKKDPKAASKKAVDAFAKIGVSARHLKDYLGHDAENMTPDEIVDLQTIYGSISTGDTTWASIMANQGQGVEEGELRMEDLGRGEESEHKGPAGADVVAGAAEDNPSPPSDAATPPPTSGDAEGKKASTPRADEADKYLAIAEKLGIEGDLRADVAMGLKGLKADTPGKLFDKIEKLGVDFPAAFRTTEAGEAVLNQFNAMMDNIRNNGAAGETQPSDSRAGETPPPDSPAPAGSPPPSPEDGEAEGRETQQAPEDSGAEIEIPAHLPVRLDRLLTLHPNVFDAAAKEIGVDGLQIDDMQEDQQRILYRLIHARLGD